MVVAIFEELASKNPNMEFTVGSSIDDVTHRSLPIVSTVPVHRPDEVQALFLRIGSDGTVGATRTPSRSLVTTPISMRKATSSTTRRSLEP